MKKKSMSLQGRKNISFSLKGRKLSKKHKINLSQSMIGINKGDKNPNWKGGRILNNQGYISLWKENGCITEHRLIMENKLERKLKLDEIVHHKNGIKTDNRIENLQLMNNKEHSKFHLNELYKLKMQKIDGPFKLYLISNTIEPLKTISCAIENIGIGKDVLSFSDIDYESAKNSVEDTMKSFLTSPLEYASFNFFVQNVPIFIVREWQRARVGWSYAERSMRFFQIDYSILEKIDRRFYPNLDNKQWKEFIKNCKYQVKEYIRLKKTGFENQNARNVLGVWLPTQLQVSANYRAIRDTMSLRLSSQAHPGWQLVANEIKKRISEIDNFLGKNLVDVCQINKRCVWHSKLDRPCKNCIDRGVSENNHQHKFDLKTKSGNLQCSCGELEKKQYDQ